VSTTYTQLEKMETMDEEREREREGKIDIE
jgi:hypothetical protein